MMGSENGLPKAQRRFGTVWGELDYLCRRIHYWLYQRGSPAWARRYLNRLERVLKILPRNDSAILREEALALFHELKGQGRQAIEHRRREIRLMERLHRSIKKSVQAGEYDEEMGRSIRAGHDETALAQRRAILQTLREGYRSVPTSA